MQKILSSILVFSLTLSIDMASAANPDPHNFEPLPRQITVNGSANVAQEPDQITFVIGIEERGSDPKSMQRSVSKTANKVVNILKKSGIKDTQIQSMRMQLQPFVEYKNGQRVQQDFVLGRTIQVTHNLFDAHAEILEEIVAIGATRISGIQFTVSDQDVHYQKALELAVINARERAQALLTPLGETLGEVLQIHENSRNHGPVQHSRMLMAESQADNQLNLPGQKMVNAQVNITFAIAK